MNRQTKKVWKLCLQKRKFASMILTGLQILQVKEIVQTCLYHLYENDGDMIRRGGMEQAIAFRFGL